MKILLVEDTKDLNRALTVALEHEGYSVESAFDGEEATDKIMTNGYDVVILDIMMPKKDGIEVLKDMRSRNVVTPVIMLTAKAEVDDKVLGLDAGADDYLTKPFAIKELLARVRAMARRKNGYDSEMIEYGDIKLNGGNFELSCENSVILSAKEYELLKTLIRNEGKVLSSDYLLEHVWREDDGANEDTVSLYIMYLNGKLNGIASNVEIAGKLESGYCI